MENVTSDQDLGKVVRATVLAGLRAVVGSLEPGIELRTDPNRAERLVAHRRVERHLYDHFDRITVAGTVVERSGFVGRGGFAAAVDPAAPDPARRLCSSVAVLLYQCVDAGSGSHLVPVATAVGRTDGWLAWQAGDDAVRTETAAREVIDPRPWGDLVLDPPADEPDTAAASPGAATLLPELLGGQITSLTVSAPTPPWHAAHLLLGARAGLDAVLVDTDGRPGPSLRLSEIERFFVDPDLGGDGHPRTVPAHRIGA